MPDLIAASPNCFLEMSPFVAYRQFPALGIRHVEVPCGPTGMAPFAPELIVGDHAAGRGVRLALETHGGITRNGALCQKLLDEVDHPAVGVNYDTGNIYYYNEGFDPAEDVKLIAHRVIQVHLKDTRGGKGEWLFCGLGEGRVDFPAVVKTLRESGFDGPWSLEIEGERGEDLTRAQSAARIRRSLEYLKSIGFDFELPGEAGSLGGLQAQETGH